MGDSGDNGAGAMLGQSCPFGQFVSGISPAGVLICAPPPSTGGGGGDGSGLQGSGTPKRLPVYATASTLKPSIVTESSNKIGINTTPPGRTLEV